MTRRAFVVVIDACGAGELPDAAAYGDAGANTLAHVAQAVGGLRLPVLERLGLGSILALDGVAPSAVPVMHGRLAAAGPGKDSTTGHWELMGAIAPAPLPTYPDGFPDALVRTLERATGHRSSATGPTTGSRRSRTTERCTWRRGADPLHVADSVLQLAAHVDVLAEASCTRSARRRARS